MGGPGSGYWYRGFAKCTVENCLSLDVNRMARDNTFYDGRTGVLTWRWSNPTRPESRADYFVSELDGLMYLVLSYALPEKENITLPIRLQTTIPHYGGLRWWFTCPLIVKNQPPCRRRVGKLYLRGKYFGCRSCHDLVYRSSQEAHQTDRLAARIGCTPDILREISERWK